MKESKLKVAKANDAELRIMANKTETKAEKEDAKKVLLSRFIESKKGKGKRRGSRGSKCAREGQRCWCRGKVTYGARNQWRTKTAYGGEIWCSNNVFGDPIPGVVKDCFCKTQLRRKAAW